MINRNKIMAGTASHSGNWMHFGFKLSVLLKGIGALCEILGGILLLYLNPIRMGRLVFFLTHRELAEDPGDRLANVLLHYGYGFSAGTQLFTIMYLLSHGITKCLLAYVLWHKKRWAYPFAIGLLLFFIGYQIWSYCMHPSIFLVLLTVWDAVMILLTAVEYRRQKYDTFKSLHRCSVSG